jgi:hypothetical protein
MTVAATGAIGLIGSTVTRLLRFVILPTLSLVAASGGRG